MSCKNHGIEIDNRNKNNFSRELILISGCVKNQCEHEYVELVQYNHDLRRTKLFKKHFKFLVKLEQQQEENVIKLKYCQEEIQLQYVYKSINPVLYDIQPLYIIPRNHDGKFQTLDGNDNSINSALIKINLLTSLAQCVISSKLLECDGNENEVTYVLNKCEVFYSRLYVDEVWQLDQFELYDRIAQEILDRFGCDIIERRKFIGFMSCTKFLGLSDKDDHNYANIMKNTLANPSLGCGFLALLGNGCFYALPKNVADVTNAFCNRIVVDTTKLLDDSNYRRTYGGCFSTTLGSLIHETGHLFDLGHTQNGLMGNDIDHVHRFFCCENFTEIMPKRNVSNCQRSLVHKKSNLLQNKLTKISRKGEKYLEKFREQKNNDLTFFEENCRVILRNHNWFTQKNAKNLIYFDEIEKTVCSENEPIVLIEIRDLKCNYLLKKNWNFIGMNITKHKIDDNLSDCMIFAITLNGSMLKKNISANE